MHGDNLDLGDRKLFVFDWSGVVSDDTGVARAAVNHIRTERGIYPLDREEYLATCVESAGDQMIAHGVPAGGNTYDEKKAFLNELYRTTVDMLQENGLAEEPYMYKDRVPEVFGYLKEHGKTIVVLSTYPQPNLEK